MKTSFVRILLLSAAVAGMAGDVHAQQSDAAVILQFERAADTYAFTHRQDDRRGTTPARLVEGEFFTPIAAAAFRARIRSVAGCNTPAHGEGGSVVPAVNASSASTDPTAACLAGGAAAPAGGARISRCRRGIASRRRASRASSWMSCTRRFHKIFDDTRERVRVRIAGLDAQVMARCAGDHCRGCIHGVCAGSEARIRHQDRRS